MIDSTQSQQRTQGRIWDWELRNAVAWTKILKTALPLALHTSLSSEIVFFSLGNVISNLTLICSLIAVVLLANCTQTLAHVIFWKHAMLLTSLTKEVSICMHIANRISGVRFQNCSDATKPTHWPQTTRTGRKSILCCKGGWRFATLLHIVQISIFFVVPRK